MNPACLLDSLLTPKCSFLKVYFIRTVECCDNCLHYSDEQEVKRN